MQTFVIYQVYYLQLSDWNVIMNFHLILLNSAFVDPWTFVEGCVM